MVGKVFEKQFNRLSSGVYSVSGPWSDPELVLTRAFDNTPSMPKPVEEESNGQSSEAADSAVESDVGAGDAAPSVDGDAPDQPSGDSSS